MKKFLLVLLMISLVMACVGCGSENTISTNYSNDNFSSNESVSNVESVVEDNKPHGIEGLIDTKGSPAGKTYLGVDGSWTTTEFFEDFTCRAKITKTDELKYFDDWKFIGDGIIRKIYSKDKTVYEDFFIYKDYLVDFEAKNSWGTFEFDSSSDIVLIRNGKAEIDWNYTKLDDRVVKIEYLGYDDNLFTYYLFIDNDERLHETYPKVN